MSEILSMKTGYILVANMNDPDWVTAIIITSAVITNHVMWTFHTAIVSCDLGVTCIVGTKDSIEILDTGKEYTID